uniref:Uncharacterized protein n=1 Tax=Oryza glumipatula TaxID=40148 RepID=A0A0D9Y7I7_9ORYZ
MAFERLHAGDDDGGGGDDLIAFKWLHTGDDDCGGSDNLMAFERLHAGDETVLTAAKLGCSLLFVPLYVPPLLGTWPTSCTLSDASSMALIDRHIA